MKMFFKDYWDLCKTSWGFCKKHPLGILVYLLVVFGASLASFYLEPIVENTMYWLESRKRVSKEEGAC